MSKVSNKCGNLCERPDWLADDAVRREQVSIAKFPANREKNREFSRFAGSNKDSGPTTCVISMACTGIPYAD